MYKKGKDEKQKIQFLQTGMKQHDKCRACGYPGEAGAGIHGKQWRMRVDRLKGDYIINIIIKDFYAPPSNLSSVSYTGENRKSWMCFKSE